MDYDSAGCLNLDSKIKREFLPVNAKSFTFKGEGRYIQAMQTTFKPLMMVKNGLT